MVSFLQKSVLVDAEGETYLEGDVLVLLGALESLCALLDDVLGRDGRLHHLLVCELAW